METAIYISHLINKIMLVLAIFCLIVYSVRLVYFFKGFFKQKRFKQVEEKTNFAVLIAARYESKVIRNILNSLKEQNYPKDKIHPYIIVESEDDPTCEIVREYGYDVFVRPDLEGKRTKGWALDQCVQDIFNKGIEYDSFVIFDADNKIDPDFFNEMNNMRINTGYEMGLGSRQSSNYSSNWISMCACIVFLMISSIGSKGKMDVLKKAVICGTGFYVDYSVLKQAGGYIWHSLCEDYEMTVWAISKSIRIGYCDYAVFYDEQPTNYITNLKQHARWTWGILMGDKKMRPEVFKSYVKGERDLAKTDFLVSNVPIAVLIIVAIISAIYNLVLGFLTPGWNEFYLVTILIFLFYYFILTFLAFSSMHMNREYLKKASIGMKLWCGFTFFFYMIDFGAGFLWGSNPKNRVWNVIEHGEKDN